MTKIEYLVGIAQTSSAMLVNCQVTSQKGSYAFPAERIVNGCGKVQFLVPFQRGFLNLLVVIICSETCYDTQH